MSRVHPRVSGATPAPVPYPPRVYLGYEQRVRADEGDDDDDDIVTQGQQCRRRRRVVGREDKGDDDVAARGQQRCQARGQG